MCSLLRELLGYRRLSFLLCGGRAAPYRATRQGWNAVGTTWRPQFIVPKLAFS
ncbi:hypothetical protein LNA02_15510 [Levilactobacillus namurensis]|nr:hypothetical protein LNA02_15510 [Levilactobacillus namurensis]